MHQGHHDEPQPFFRDFDRTTPVEPEPNFGAEPGGSAQRELIEAIVVRFGAEPEHAREGFVRSLEEDWLELDRLKLHTYDLAESAGRGPLMYEECKQAHVLPGGSELHMALHAVLVADPLTADDFMRLTAGASGMLGLDIGALHHRLS